MNSWKYYLAYFHDYNKDNNFNYDANGKNTDANGNEIDPNMYHYDEIESLNFASGE